MHIFNVMGQGTSRLLHSPYTMGCIGNSAERQEIIQVAEQARSGPIWYLTKCMWTIYVALIK